MAAGFLLIAITGVALLLLARRTEASRRLLRVGAVCGATGAALAGAGLLLNRVVFDDEFRYMPAFAWSGMGLVAIGVVLLALAALRARLLPPPLATFVITSAVLLVASNEQTQLAWLSLPFGIAWLLVGLRLRHLAATTTSGQRLAQPA